MSDPIKPPAARRPEEALELVSEALSDGDLEAALAQYESPALLASWPGSALLDDYDVRGILTCFMALRLPLSVRIVTVLATPDVALVVCRRLVAGTSPDGEHIRLSGDGCAAVRRHPDGAWRIAADAWQAAEPPAECSLSRWPDPGTTVRSELIIPSYNSAVADADGAAFELGTDGPKVILVGIDGSVTSLRAGAYAAGLARRQGARLVAVYVEQRSGMYGAAATGAGAGAIAEQDKALDETAAELRRQAEEGAALLGVQLEFVTAFGDPYRELRRVADEIRADAVIVGASAQAGHRWVGSLAVRLVKAGRWPVTVVP